MATAEDPRRDLLQAFDAAAEAAPARGTGLPAIGSASVKGEHGTTAGSSSGNSAPQTPQAVQPLTRRCKICWGSSAVNRWSAYACGQPTTDVCHACQTVKLAKFPGLDNEAFCALVNGKGPFDNHWNFKFWRRQVHQTKASGQWRTEYTSPPPLSTDAAGEVLRMLPLETYKQLIASELQPGHEMGTLRNDTGVFVRTKELGQFADRFSIVATYEEMCHKPLARSTINWQST